MQTHDKENVILNIKSENDGVESCDWANMLLRMYLRWAERRGYQVEIADVLQGEEEGIKSVTLMIEEQNAYGNLKSEQGLHRLVRISPFNAQGKRQTSFASVEVLPDIENSIDVQIDDKDIRVDAFRSSGYVGQVVNMTDSDSAVRITHLATGLSVTCRNTRSRTKNRASAMKILKARLYQIELDKNSKEIEENCNSKGEINLVPVIRSYVFHPYQMVKDLRTGEQTGDTQGVLDGDLDAFIHAF